MCISPSDGSEVTIQISVKKLPFFKSILQIFLSYSLPSDVSVSPTANRSKINENLVNSSRFSTSNCDNLYHADSNYYPYNGSPKGTALSSRSYLLTHSCLNGLFLCDFYYLHIYVLELRFVY